MHATEAISRINHGTVTCPKKHNEIADEHLVVPQFLPINTAVLIKHVASCNPVRFRWVRSYASPGFWCLRLDACPEAIRSH
ncbi:hypothetical protein MTP99_011028 [Tenebrio molitor]|jgi:hypothetical protein|nr:hypothetical protein MTP99_011028 [Tenebrio molitor]